MLKNPANAILFTMIHSKLATAYAMNAVNNSCDLSKINEMRRMKSFIEQCPLKIKRIKIEGFV
jgi:hypothetical protein